MTMRWLMRQSSTIMLMITASRQPLLPAQHPRHPRHCAADEVYRDRGRQPLVLAARRRVRKRSGQLESRVEVLLCERHAVATRERKGELERWVRPNEESLASLGRHYEKLAWRF